LSREASEIIKELPKLTGAERRAVLEKLRELAVMIDNLATVTESEIDSILGHLTDLTKANTALKHTLGI